MHRRYISEWNRTIGDNIRVAARRLRGWGLNVSVLSHKTSLVIERPHGMAWSDFKTAIRSALQPRYGSVLIFSESTGKSFVCSNRGNRPGRFQRV